MTAPSRIKTIFLDALDLPDDERASFLDEACAGDEELRGRVGPYVLEEEIGSGGFGVVFRATQEEPVRRQVALKVVKLGMDTKSVIARFELERQALAMMAHPNIARVFDAGVTFKTDLHPKIPVFGPRSVVRE